MPKPKRKFPFWPIVAGLLCPLALCVAVLSPRGASETPAPLPSATAGLSHGGAPAASSPAVAGETPGASGPTITPREVTQTEPTWTPLPPPTAAPARPTATAQPAVIVASPAPAASGFVCSGGEACIKGNADSKLYHLPGCPSYKVTKAERLFVSEAEAQAAGYARAGNCK